MAGTKIGGKNAAQTNKTKYGADFYKKIGSKGGANSKRYLSHEEAVALGKLGGRKGSRLGQTHSLATKRKMSVSQKAFWQQRKNVNAV